MWDPLNQKENRLEKRRIFKEKVVKNFLIQED